MLSTAELTADPWFPRREPALGTRIDTSLERLARASGPCWRKSFAYRGGASTRTVFARIFVRVSKAVRYTNDSSWPIRSLSRGFPGETAPGLRGAGGFPPPIRSCIERGAVRERFSRSFSFAYRGSYGTRTTFRPGLGSSRSRYRIRPNHAQARFGTSILRQRWRRADRKRRGHDRRQPGQLTRI